MYAIHGSYFIKNTQCLAWKIVNMKEFHVIKTHSNIKKSSHLFNCKYFIQFKFHLQIVIEQVDVTDCSTIKRLTNFKNNLKNVLVI